MFCRFPTTSSRKAHPTVHVLVNTERQRIYHAAHLSSEKAKKKGYKSILDRFLSSRFLNSPRYRQIDIEWTKPLLTNESEPRKLSVIKNVIMSARNPKVVADRARDLSSSKKPIVLLCFLFLPLTFFLKWEFWMILFRADAILASSISKFGK